MAGKAKARTTIIKLISSAKTGYIRTLTRPRTCPAVSQVRYDPIAKRHVLFTESKKRGGAPDKAKSMWAYLHLDEAAKHRKTQEAKAAKKK